MTDATLLELGREVIGALAAYDVEVPRRLCVLHRPRECDQLAQARLAVVLPRRPAPVGPAVEVGKLHAHDRGLQVIQARVVAHVVVGDLVVGAVDAQHPRPRGQPFLGRGDRAAVAEAPEVLGGKEAERRRGAQGARATDLRQRARRAASSSTGTPSASISATGATLPKRCTTTTALVRGVRAARTVSAVTQNVSGSTSQNTGSAPVGGIASALA